MARVLTGAKAIFKANGQIFAFAQSVSIQQEDSVERIPVLGQLEDADLAETGHRCSLSVNYFKVVNPEILQTAEQMGIEEALLSEQRNRGYFDCEVMDDNENIIYKATDCKCTGGSGQLDARGVWNGTLNFEARKGKGL